MFPHAVILIKMIPVLGLKGAVCMNISHKASIVIVSQSGNESPNGLNG